MVKTARTQQLFRMRKYSIQRGIWYIGGRRKKQRAGVYLLAALAAPILGGLGGIVLKNIFGAKIRRRRQ